MNYSADRKLIDDAYARGGKEEAVSAFYGILFDPGEDWPDARIVSTVVYVRDLPGS
ncbi:hypothetical protein [Streptomyces nigrescens]|uniref:hypothetical protein n=1 Tax=Streptomyces nigrescens TaxID=1920 RepID=UPI0036F98802